MEEQLTDYQLKKMLQMIYMIVDQCENLEEAKAKIQQLATK